LWPYINQSPLFGAFSSIAAVTFLTGDAAGPLPAAPDPCATAGRDMYDEHMAPITAMLHNVL
jgi:hypothetical protein